MIQRSLGVSIGALVTFVLLWFNHADANACRLAAIVVGAIASFFWPIVAGFFLARRVKQRREMPDAGRSRQAGLGSDQGTRLSLPG